MDILEVCKFRHACKAFGDQAISDQDLRAILEAGVLAPSSFGLEPWKLVVVRDKIKKEQLQSACFKQPQVGSADAVVVILGRKDLDIDGVFMQKCLDRFGVAKESMTGVIGGFMDRMSDEQKHGWINKQCAFIASNLMMAAAGLGIDSCPMEGFLESKVKATLGLQDDVFVSLVLPLGYRANEPKREKMRFDFEDIVAFA